MEKKENCSLKGEIITGKSPGYTMCMAGQPVGDKKRYLHGLVKATESVYYAQTSVAVQIVGFDSWSALQCSVFQRKTWKDRRMVESTRGDSICLCVLKIELPSLHSLEP